ncbi:cell wall hydrolase [Mesobacillus zeae]|uniref:LysM peptidoglycan-binding domain-containing protein n=1 Tax=Mesobacillus zeae TaxID=1917180 RepID=A0A398BFI6_9BACI|nr:cell wall hydrolase [Mesobacillus zeae]RID88782.1 LysM peptidoglycan-binding domain-containing protein [Mesobacillus zeae]
MSLTKKALVAVMPLLVVLLFSFQPEAEAAGTYSVKKGDTYWTLASKFGVSVNELKKANRAQSNSLKIGQTLSVPNSSVSNVDKDLMARLVRAEAESEPYAGKVAVATVILNRVASPQFPNSVRGVVYENVKGHYAFSPVKNGRINRPADAASKRAVNEALAYSGQGKGSLYFYNPRTASSSWVFSRQTTVTIGNHRFAR